MTPSAPDPREPQVSDEVRALIRDYDKQALLAAALLHSHFTWAGIELLAVALANNPTGHEKTVPPEHVNRLMLATQFCLSPAPAFGSATGKDLLSLLRQTRGMHPVWYASPLFAEILQPFDADLVSKVGYTSGQIFQAVVKLAEEHGKIPPAELAPLYDQMVIPLEDCVSVSALWNAAVITVDGGGYVLTNKLAEVTYRILNDKLASVNKFTNRKGKSIEAFARKRLRPLMKNWRWEHNYEAGGREKDLIGIGKDAGLALECKGFKFATSAVSWSHLNAVRDAGGVIEGLEQIDEPLRILREGGKLDKPAIRVGPKKVVQGIVMTDNVYTPYVRACLDNWKEETEESEWHGEGVWVASMIDLDLIVKCTRRMSVMLDYLSHIRANENIRLTAEPEAFLLYTTDIAIPMVGDDKPFTIARGFPWEKVEKEGFDAMQTIWIERGSEVERLEAIDEVSRAMRYIDQDRRKATKRMRQVIAPLKLPKHGAP